jgi:hypothetical protein
MTTKTIKTTLFASLIAAMILPFSGMDFAEADKNAVRTDMKSIHDAIQNAVGSERKELVAEYKLKNQEFNDSIYVAPPRDFVAEWQVLELEYMDLVGKESAAKKDLEAIRESGSSGQQATKQAEIDNMSTRIKTLRNQIGGLQAESVAFMKMSPDVEQRYERIVSALHEKYGGEASGNAFVMAGINYEQKKLVAELTTALDDSVEFENSSVAIAEEIRSLAGEDNVIITIDQMKPTACTNYLGACSPLVGGVAIARYDDSSNLAGSIGYKATKNGQTGYVTAGHVVDYYGTGNRKMLQPVGGSQISDGTGYPFTTSASSGDVSFQKTSVSINDDIYYSSNTKIDVANYATSSSDHTGQFVYKMGAGGGLTWGYVQTHWSNTNVWTTSASVSGGDSGGPLFQITGSSGGQYYGKLFGHAFMSYQGSAVYQPTEKMIANHGIYPATS